jgi:alpha-galactosidase
MIKVTLLGAGSGFTQPLFTDILNIEGLDEGVIGLVDIDAARLAINVRLMRRLLELMGKTAWRLEASTDRRKILKGTDYLISTIEVSGVACVRYDNDIPLKYGIDQCIGDTIGPGGVMKALRTLPPFLEILEDAQRLCPHALIMNYTNPMSIMTLGAVRASPQPFAGLCHSVQGNSRQIAQILGVPYEELVWQCGGINHMAWFTELRWHGRDMLPALREAAYLPQVIEQFPVRTDLIRNLGYFSTESCGHYSEYVPYYRKRKDLLKKHTGKGYLGESGFYANNWPRWRQDLDRRRREMAEGKRPIPTARGHEYASDIIEAHVFDRKKVIYASVPNTGLIPNLPQTGVVEVATLVDSRGYMPTYFGNLPEACAALCRSNMAVFELAADGILKKDRESVIHAMMMDPLSAAVCSLGEIRDMAEELFAAEKAYIPAWCAKPKVVKSARRPAAPGTGLLRTLYVSRVLPHRPLAELDFPGSIRSLGLKPRTFDGFFCSRHAELDKAGPALVYFGARFRCPTDMKLTAFLGYDGPVKAWLNGREVFADPKGTNPARPDAGKISFPARKGPHEFLVALDSNGGQAWGIFLRFERTDLRASRTAALPVFDHVRLTGVEEVSSMSARGHNA